MLDWATNVGYPGYATAAIDEIYSTWLLNTMFGKVAAGQATPGGGARRGRGGLQAHLRQVEGEGAGLSPRADQDRGGRLRIRSLPPALSTVSTLERETAAGSLARRRGRRLADRPGWLGALMIGPAVLYIVLVVGMPFVLALYYSVSDITAGSQSLNFVGLKNFADIVGTSQFRTALRNTFVFAVVSQVIVLVGANILALALMRDFRGKWIVRLLLLLPWVGPDLPGNDRVALDPRFDLQRDQLDARGPRPHPARTTGRCGWASRTWRWAQ